MKICITAKEGSLDSELDPRFGRAQNYIIVDTETADFSVISNDGLGAVSGAGTSAVQKVANEKVEAVISGNFGPNAAAGLSALSIGMYTSAVDTIKNVLEKFNAGKLQKVTAATVTGHQN